MKSAIVVISTVLRFHDRQPGLAALAAVLAACSVAALLMFWGSVEVHRQAADVLDALGAQCADAGAADHALCDALAGSADNLAARGRLMLALQAAALALVAAGFALILRRAPRLLSPEKTPSAGRPAAPPAHVAASAVGAGPAVTAASASAGAALAHESAALAGATAPGAPLAGEPDPLRGLREAGRLLRGGDVNAPALRRALAVLQTALGAGNVALRLPLDLRRLLGGNALICTEAEPALALPSGADSRGDVGARLIPPGPDLPLRTLVVPVASAGLPTASLIAEFAPEAPVGERQIQLAECFAMLVALAIAGVCRSHEERRVALMEERSAIAGELHDSLAQSLAFMKIQVAQLQRALDNDTVPAGVRQAALDLRGGLSTAYREVRELIAAFRVSMGPGGLLEAVQETIDEFGQRSGLVIEFEHELDKCQLEINEEFHVMQVIREALSNIVRHAGAEHAWVAVRYGPGHRCTITVEDDGRGLPAMTPEGNHYGMSIMKERARSLDGEVTVEPRDGGGTRVQLSFEPQRLPADLLAGGAR